MASAARFYGKIIAKRSPPTTRAGNAVIPAGGRRPRRAHHLHGYHIIFSRAAGWRAPVEGYGAIAGNEARRFRKQAPTVINSDPVRLHPGVIGDGHPPRRRPQVMPRFGNAAPTALHLGIAGLHIGRAFQRPFSLARWGCWAWWRRGRPDPARSRVRWSRAGSPASQPRVRERSGCAPAGSPAAGRTAGRPSPGSAS